MKNKKVYLGNIKDKEAELLVWKKIPFPKRVGLARKFAEEIKEIQKKFKIP